LAEQVSFCAAFNGTEHDGNAWRYFCYLLLLVLEPPSSLPEQVNKSSVQQAVSHLFKEDGLNKLIPGLLRVGRELKSGVCPVSDESFQKARQLVEAGERAAPLRDSQSLSEAVASGSPAHFNVAIDKILSCLSLIVKYKALSEELALKRKQTAELQRELGAAQVQLDERGASEQQHLGISTHLLAVVKAVRKKGQLTLTLTHHPNPKPNPNLNPYPNPTSDPNQLARVA
tara:strand:- start:96 stop:782 length:687 start_codon:yes stop_codon:yes gene_type:complete